MSVKVSRILHAGYIIEYNLKKIIFDPIFENPFSRNCFAYPEVQFNLASLQNDHFDAIFISHVHDDHFSLISLNYLDKRTAIYLYANFEIYRELLQKLGFINIYFLNLFETVVIGDIKVTPFPAMDADVDTIFRIQAEDINILNVVDSWIDYNVVDHLANLCKGDLILWPFQTMREIEVLSPSRFEHADQKIPFEWIEQIQKLNSRGIVPSSCQFIHEKWSWYNQALFPITYQKFKDTMQETLPNMKVIFMKPSQSIIVTSQNMTYSQSLNWVQVVGEQNVDYYYNPKLIPSTTDKISRQFISLQPDESEIVWQFCKINLIEKFKQLATNEELYFTQIRSWNLKIYNEQGQSIDFYYHIQSQYIELLSEKIDNDNLGWLTEVPLYKLYHAIKSGESLTSMYIRVNDIRFNNEVEIQLKEVSLLNDPLIRILFENEVATYQKAQLASLQNLNKDTL